MGNAKKIPVTGTKNSAGSFNTKQIVKAINDDIDDGVASESDISTNAANIATNETDISTNAGNITTNTTDIGTNATDIAALDLQQAADNSPSASPILEVVLGKPFSIHPAVDALVAIQEWRDDNDTVQAVMKGNGVLMFTGVSAISVPMASNNAGGLTYITDEVGGAVLAWSDGTNWRRVTDGAIISDV